MRASRYLKRMIERSKLYLYYIVEEVEKRGMPTEIALLLIVRERVNPMAYSRSHASGLWQFIPSTGKTYKLSQNWWADSRRDVVASTMPRSISQLVRAARRLAFWRSPSYNYGENGVARAIEQTARRAADRLPEPQDPPETRGYVPKLRR